MIGLKPVDGGSIPSFLGLTGLDLNEGGFFKCVVRGRTPVQSFDVSCS